ncbi:alpha/beta hydrolase [Penicillium cosmopolitanum]|uniref:Alpha/beta hydrolase n=1 Tax=Penicillium cosmopolitanum TaxID=1131564 RepID=A0A9W9V6M8_9EURO|nr:alpha/beta hydrolase [Penicillium cosmopolitanum]KAJ5369639.1 alpha/beta hydrolase [Penicillium cosmopolitanum]
MEPLATQNTLINGNRIAYGIFGDGELVVLLHGTPFSSLVWRDIVPNLVKAGYKVHLFDLLGYGLSERPWNQSIDTSPTAQVPIFEGLLSFWNIEKTHIVAHDFGGAIAQRFGIRSPERVKSLTLIDTVSFDSYPSPRTKQLMENGLEKMITASDGDHRAHFREWILSGVYEKKKFENEGTLDTFLEYISGPIGQGSYFQHQIRHYDPKHTMEIVDQLPTLGQLPVHLIWGKDDAWQVVDWAYKLNKTIPGSKLDIVDGAGHFSQHDKPEEISGLIIDFLRQN